MLAAPQHFKAKVITVAPHARLSYQSHEHREEHWIVVRGAGQVILNDVTRDIKNRRTTSSSPKAADTA